MALIGRLFAAMYAAWVRGVELHAQAIDAMTPGFDDHADEAVRLVSRDYPTTPAERRFANDVENYLKERAR